MKLMKKISVILLSLCLSISCFSFVARAADGQIQFTDPETKVGDIVEVKCVVRSAGESLGNIQLSLKYDSNALRFDSGDGISAGGDGSLSCTGTGTSSEHAFLIKFQALMEGESVIEVVSSSVTSASGVPMELDLGNSTVKVGAGDPSKITTGMAANATDVAVTVDGVEYKLSDSFADIDIPAGFTKSEMTYESQNRQMAYQDSSGIYLGFLIDPSGAGDFFMYNEDTATFSPFEQIDISDATSIMVLSDTDQVKLPTSYQKVTLNLNNKKFPAWQDSTRDGFYVLYAMNNRGSKEYYQYDSDESTYQRFEAPKIEAADKTKDDSFLGQLKSFIEKHIQMVVLVGGFAIIVVIILFIVLGVKLHNRNAELDDLYEEYGIDEDEEDVKPAVKSSERMKKPSKREVSQKEDGEEFESFDTGKLLSFETGALDVYQEEDIDEIDFDEPDGVEAFDDADDESLIDDLDELLVEKPKKRRSHEEDDDAFKVDFIDLD